MLWRQHHAGNHPLHVAASEPISICCIHGELVFIARLKHQKPTVGWLAFDKQTWQALIFLLHGVRSPIDGTC